MTIRWRLSLWFTGIVTLLMLLLALGGWLGLRHALHEQAEHELVVKHLEIQGFLETLAESFSQAKVKFQLEQYASYLDELMAHDQAYFYNDLWIQLTNTHGQLISQSSNLKGKSLPIQLKPQSPKELLLETDPPQKIIYAVYPLLFQGRNLGYFQLGMSLSKTDAFLEQVLWFDALGIVVAAFLSLFFGQLLAHRALSPMVQIAEEVQALEEEALFTPIRTEHLEPDEILMLTETFNGLLRRLQNLFGTQQQFLSDAAHEFSSPLTAIRGHVQLIQKRAGTHPEILEKSTATILRETQRLERLTQDLLLLARLESQAPQFQRIDLSLLLIEIYQDLGPLYPRLTLSDLPIKTWVQGDTDTLKRLFINLIMNALKATELNQGSVNIKLTAQPVCVRIVDQGCGIAPEHVPHLFERFYRVDHSRQRRSGGAGIGLALVQEIVRCHQGQISVKSDLNQGSCFEVSFPPTPQNPE